MKMKTVASTVMMDTRPRCAMTAAAPLVDGDGDVDTATGVGVGAVDGDGDVDTATGVVLGVDGDGDVDTATGVGGHIGYGHRYDVLHFLVTSVPAASRRHS